MKIIDVSINNPSNAPDDLIEINSENNNDIFWLFFDYIMDFQL